MTLSVSVALQNKIHVCKAMSIKTKLGKFVFVFMFTHSATDGHWILVKQTMYFC